MWYLIVSIPDLCTLTYFFIYLKIQKGIYDNTLQKQDSAILNSSKLDFYKRVCKIQARDSIGCSSDRSCLAKLRVSAHTLPLKNVDTLVSLDKTGSVQFAI